MDMNAIVLGYEGKVEMLNAIFGSSKDKPNKPKPTARDVKDFARTHNAVRKKKVK